MSLGCKGICRLHFVTMPNTNGASQNYLAGFKRCTVCGDVNANGIMILVPEGMSKCPCCGGKLGEKPMSAKARRKLRALLAKQERKRVLMARA